MWEEITTLLRVRTTAIEIDRDSYDFSTCLYSKDETMQHKIFKTNTGIIMSIVDHHGSSNHCDDYFVNLIKSLGLYLTPASILCKTDGSGLPIKPKSQVGTTCCVICNKDMKNRSKSKKNSTEIVVSDEKTIEEDGMIKEEEEEEERSLRLCGCVYCQFCLENVISMQLRSDKSEYSIAILRKHYRRRSLTRNFSVFAMLILCL